MNVDQSALETLARLSSTDIRLSLNVLQVCTFFYIYIYFFKIYIFASIRSEFETDLLDSVLGEKA